jgi:RNA polymerase sigma-70 factor, ECF subfamily
MRFFGNTWARRDSTPAMTDSFAVDLHQYQAALTRSARMMCANAADADDLVHDVYERALRCSLRAIAHANPRAWLHSILRNLFIDRCRHARRHPHPLPLEHVAAAELELPGAEQAPPWRALTTAQVRAALADLPEEFRGVFELHAFEHLRYDEIAARLGIPTSTVGTRLRRARHRLRAILQAMVEDCPERGERGERPERGERGERA